MRASLAGATRACFGKLIDFFDENMLQFIDLELWENALGSIAPVVNSSRRVAANAKSTILRVARRPVSALGAVVTLASTQRPHAQMPGIDSDGLQPPTFDDAFRHSLSNLFRWRRDVRRFRSDPIDPRAIEELIELATLAPSVGHSQPWRFVMVEDSGRRQAIVDNFNVCNAAALGNYEGAEAALYAKLKLAGLCEAPIHLAVFCDGSTADGRGLGRMTMPETLVFSVIGSLQNLMLAARARGLGVGWVSILEPREIAAILEIPTEWRFIAYLCIGRPEEEHLDPELERHGWQARLPQSTVLHRR